MKPDGYTATCVAGYTLWNEVLEKIRHTSSLEYVKFSFKHVVLQLKENKTKYLRRTSYRTPLHLHSYSAVRLYSRSCLFRRVHPFIEAILSDSVELRDVTVTTVQIFRLTFPALFPVRRKGAVNSTYIFAVGQNK